MGYDLAERSATPFACRWQRLDKGQLIKWTVYSLLLVNWGYYALDESLEKKHFYIDFQDAVMWLLVVWAIELAVWLQNRNIAGGPLMVLSHAARAGYAILFVHALFWLWVGHWVWAWDQFLWIAGFWAIENNVSEWRDEIMQKNERRRAL